VPIDIYEGKTHRLSLSEDAFLSLAGAQDELRERAGRMIDPYATTTVEPEHALLWLSGLRRILPELRDDARARQACENLISLLSEVTKRKQTLVIEGE
jgi:hypothetical protein